VIDDIDVFHCDGNGFRVLDVEIQAALVGGDRRERFLYRKKSG
jgi:hypothetical protein